MIRPRRDGSNVSAEIAHSCLLCGGTDYTVLCEFPELTWVWCECGLIYKQSEAVPTVEYHEDYFVNRENVRRQYNRFYRPEFHGREHFVYYTPQTLSRLLKEESFDPVNVPLPHLVHRRAGGAVRAAEIAIAPLRLAAQQAKSSLALYKEFWLTATASLKARG